jgi:CBS domain-containing protein/sporulation protein YlmC with PRC-barrel domain
MTQEEDLFQRQINVPAFFNELIKKKVTLKGKKIGRLCDLIITETIGCPEVTHLLICRSFRKKPIIVPWEHVISIHHSTIEIIGDSIAVYERDLCSKEILLSSYILNEKVIDLQDHEIKVVRDLNLIVNMFNKLLVFEVDFSRYALLRRIGFTWLARVLQGSEDDDSVSSIPWMYVQRLPPVSGEERSGFNFSVLKEKLSRMHPVDLAEIIEDMDNDQRAAVFSELDTTMASDTLEEIAPPIQRKIVSGLTREKAVAVINEMTPGQAADILSGLPYDESREILSVMSEDKAQKVKSILERAEESILNYTTTKFIMLPPDAEVSVVLDEYPRLAKDKDVIMYLYIVDDSDILRGIVDIKELLMADDESTLLDIMVYDLITLTPESTLREAAEEFSRYDFRSLPVVDEDHKIIGVVSYRVIMKHRRHLID